MLIVQMQLQRPRDHLHLGFSKSFGTRTLVSDHSHCWCLLLKNHISIFQPCPQAIICIWKLAGSFLQFCEFFLFLLLEVLQFIILASIRIMTFSKKLRFRWFLLTQNNHHINSWELHPTGWKNIFDDSPDSSLERLQSGTEVGDLEWF